MNILKAVYYVFLVCIAGIAILLIVFTFPITGNFKVFVVQSGSMEPAIHTGALVAIKPAADYKIGDIVTFGQITKIKAPTTHRINDIKVVDGQPVYITKGDANNAPDAKEISKSEIIGKVLFNVPYVGYAVDTAKKPFGFMLIIIVPAVIIIYDEIKKIWREMKRMKEKKKEDKSSLSPP